MRSGIVKSWGQQKPPLGSQIDWGHPLARELVCLQLFNEAGGGILRDIARGRDYRVSGTPTWDSYGHQFNSTYCDLGNSDDFVVALGDLSFAVVCQPGHVGFPISSRSTSTGQGWELLVGENSTPGQVQLRTSVGSTLTGQQTWVTDDRYRMCIGVISPGYVTLWVERPHRLPYILSQGVRSGLCSNSQNPMLALRGTLYYPGGVSYLGVWKRALPSDEVAWLAADPYAMIQAPRLPVFYSIPAAGPTIFMRRSLAGRTGSRGSYL